MKAWYQSKTLWFNLLTGILFLVNLITGQNLIPATFAPYVVILVAIVNYILRTYFTNTEIGSPPAVPTAEHLAG